MTDDEACPVLTASQICERGLGMQAGVRVARYDSWGPGWSIKVGSDSSAPKKLFEYIFPQTALTIPQA